MPAVERLDATFTTWTKWSGEVERVLTLAGRVADLVIVDRPDPAQPFTGRALDTALFSVGRPALMVGEVVPHDLLEHVVIAWNGSLEGTRLVAQSIALLHAASRIESGVRRVRTSISSRSGVKPASVWSSSELKSKSPSSFGGTIWPAPSFRTSSWRRGCASASRTACAKSPSFLALNLYCDG